MRSERLPASARTAHGLVLRQSIKFLDPRRSFSTSLSPQRPARCRHVARASTAAQRRRVRSSSKGLSATNLACTTCVTACSMTWNITYLHDKTTILFWRDSLNGIHPATFLNLSSVQISKPCAFSKFIAQGIDLVPERIDRTSVRGSEYVSVRSPGTRTGFGECWPTSPPKGPYRLYCRVRGRSSC